MYLLLSPSPIARGVVTWGRSCPAPPLGVLPGRGRRVSARSWCWKSAGERGSCGVSDLPWRRTLQRCSDHRQHDERLVARLTPLSRSWARSRGLPSGRPCVGPQRPPLAGHRRCRACVVTLVLSAAATLTRSSRLKGADRAVLALCVLAVLVTGFLVGPVIRCRPLCVVVTSRQRTGPWEAWLCWHAANASLPLPGGREAGVDEALPAIEGEDLVHLFVRKAEAEHVQVLPSMLV